MTQVTRFLQSFGLLIARIGVGALLLLHGWNRWQGQGQGVQRQIDYLNQFGVPYPQVAAWGAIIFELVGGILLIVGALTPLVGLGILVQQILTICYTNWYEMVNMVVGKPFNPGFELNLTLGLLGLLFFVFGAGRVAIDRLFRRNKPTIEDEDDTAVSTSTKSGSTAVASGAGHRA